MMFKIIRRTILAVLTVLTVCLLLLVPNASYASEINNQKNILIIHSYNQGLEWTRDQNEGILDTISLANNNSAIYVEYMDWKNYPDKSNLQHFSDYLKYKYKGKKIDLLMTTDDAALDFALKNRKELFADAPIVFSGVNQEKTFEVNGKYDNLTGVIEEIDPTETVKMAMKINPSIKKVYLIFDNSESGKSTGKLETKKIREMNLGLEIIPLNGLGFGDMLNVVSKLDNECMLFFCTYYSDSTGSILNFNFAAKEISEHSKVPMYHQYEFGLNKGAVGGNLLSGKLYGKYAAEQAIRILNGESADKISIYSPNANRRVFDYNQLRRFEISVNQLPEGVEVINKPFSFIETYRALVVTVAGIFLVLLLFLLVLLLYIKKIRKMRQELSESNQELTQTYEELVATDDELKSQLKEISAIQTTLMESEEKYTYLALHDILTGLPNRRSLFEDFKAAISLQKDKKASLMFIDMDDFKYINDTMGHEFGDLLIKAASERLLLDLNKNSTLYRLGGDEFIIFTDGIDSENADELPKEILVSFKEGFNIKNIAIHINFSIGIAYYPAHGDTIEELIKSADIAMYKAKETGKNRYMVYDPSMNQDFTERMVLEKHLHTAMQNGEFELFYQPQLDLNTGKISGLEALLRWRSPELGFVSPLKFIKVAEDTHMIIELGEWVLIQACDFLSHLQQNGYKNLTVSVNISILQICQADFNDKVLKILEYFKIDPCYLELEITETILIQSFDLVCKKLKQLREKGVGIALDDFGKGYSSLSYLKQLPITTLKIDKTFIDNVSLEVENSTITRHIINMGRSMSMSVVAEGVERDDQLEYLKKYECDKMQGYLFSKPLPKNQIEPLLASN